MASKFFSFIILCWKQAGKYIWDSCCGEHLYLMAGAHAFSKLWLPICEHSQLMADTCANVSALASPLTCSFKLCLNTWNCTFVDGKWLHCLACGTVGNGSGSGSSNWLWFLNVPDTFQFATAAVGISCSEILWMIVGSYLLWRTLCCVSVVSL